MSSKRRKTNQSILTVLRTNKTLIKIRPLLVRAPTESDELKHTNPTEKKKERKRKKEKKEEEKNTATTTKSYHWHECDDTLQ